MTYLILSFSVINLLLGIIVLLRAKHEIENIIFLFFAAMASLWTFNNFYLRINTNILFLKLSYGLGIFVALFGLIWIYYFLKEKLAKFIKMTIIPFAFILFCLTIFSNYIIISLESIEPLGYEGRLGSLFPLYTIYLGSIVIALIYKLSSKLKSEINPIRKNQIYYILVGTIIFALTSFVVSFLIPTLFHTLKFTILDNLSFSLFLTFVTLAIIKHHLFNIKVIATETLTFLIWIFLLGRLLLSEHYILDSTLLVTMIIAGTLLIKSVLKEVKTREEMENLAEKLEIANVRLKELDKAKSEFITIASHQLRTPLTAIKGYTSMAVEGDFGKIPIQAKKMLKRVMQSTNRMIFLIDDFLNLSRIERGKMKYDFQKTDIKEMIKNIMNEFAGVTAKEKKEIDLKFEIDEKENYTANIDPNKILQVFSNLIDNAIKYTPKGFIKVNLYKEGGWITLKVHDSGIGMNEETQVQIFHKFTRAGQEIFQINTEGLGLGLYVAKEIIEAHKGKIWAESEGQGKGSTFYIQIPAL